MSSPPSSRVAIGGFTLIELMIVVTVIAILAALALPSYQQYIRQARRADGIADLLELQNSVEKCRVNEPTYANCDQSTEVPFPANDYYTFSITASTSAYTFTAAAISGTSQANDSGCTSLTLDDDGTKTPDGCWKK